MSNGISRVAGSKVLELTGIREQLNQLSEAKEGTRWFAKGNGQFEKAGFFRRMVETIKGWAGYGDRTSHEVVEREIIYLLASGGKFFRKEDLDNIKSAAAQVGLIQGNKESEEAHRDLNAVIQSISRRVDPKGAKTSEDLLSYVNQFDKEHAASKTFKPLYSNQSISVDSPSTESLHKTAETTRDVVVATFTPPTEVEQQPLEIEEEPEPESKSSSQGNEEFLSGGEEQQQTKQEQSSPIVELPGPTQEPTNDTGSPTLVLSIDSQKSQEAVKKEDLSSFREVQIEEPEEEDQIEELEEVRSDERIEEQEEKPSLLRRIGVAALLAIVGGAAAYSFMNRGGTEPEQKPGLPGEKDYMSMVDDRGNRYTSSNGSGWEVPNATLPDSDAYNIFGNMPKITPIQDWSLANTITTVALGGAFVALAFGSREEIQPEPVRHPVEPVPIQPIVQPKLNAVALSGGQRFSAKTFPLEPSEIGQEIVEKGGLSPDGIVLFTKFFETWFAHANDRSFTMEEQKQIQELLKDVEFWNNPDKFISSLNNENEKIVNFFNDRNTYILNKPEAIEILNKIQPITQEVSEINQSPRWVYVDVETTKKIEQHIPYTRSRITHSEEESRPFYLFDFIHLGVLYDPLFWSNRDQYWKKVEKDVLADPIKNQPKMNHKEVIDNIFNYERITKEEQQYAAAQLEQPSQTPSKEEASVELKDSRRSEPLAPLSKEEENDLIGTSIESKDSMEVAELPATETGSSFVTPEETLLESETDSVGTPSMPTVESGVDESSDKSDDLLASILKDPGIQKLIQARKNTDMDEESNRDPDVSASQFIGEIERILPRNSIQESLERLGSLLNESSKAEQTEGDELNLSMLVKSTETYLKKTKRGVHFGDVTVSRYDLSRSLTQSMIGEVPLANLGPLANLDTLLLDIENYFKNDAINEQLTSVEITTQLDSVEKELKEVAEYLGSGEADAGDQELAQSLLLISSKIASTKDEVSRISVDETEAEEEDKGTMLMNSFENSMQIFDAAAPPVDAPAPPPLPPQDYKYKINQEMENLKSEVQKTLRKLPSQLDPNAFRMTHDLLAKQKGRMYGSELESSMGESMGTSQFFGLSSRQEKKQLTLDDLKELAKMAEPDPEELLTKLPELYKVVAKLESDSHYSDALADFEVLIKKAKDSQIEDENGSVATSQEFGHINLQVSHRESEFKDIQKEAFKFQSSDDISNEAIELSDKTRKYIQAAKSTLEFILQFLGPTKRTIIQLPKKIQSIDQQILIAEKAGKRTYHLTSDKAEREKQLREAKIAYDQEIKFLETIFGNIQEAKGIIKKINPEGKISEGYMKEMQKNDGSSRAQEMLKKQQDKDQALEQSTNEWSDSQL